MKISMKKLYYLLLLVIFSCPAFAQQQIINGLVLESPSMEPLPGASVVVKGTTNGQSTDINGKFTIKASSGQVLVVSFIGMATQEIDVTQNMSSVNITLLPETMDIDEVVVVGYGTTRKRDLAGAITSLKTNEIKAGVVTDMSQFLKGRAAGVQVKQNSLEPGGSISIRVRGASSVSSNNEPLYVIDGFQTDNSYQINPEDIQSIEILKDAAATAIYGSRGANGVVLITTKRGVRDQYSVEYSYNSSIKKLKNPWELMGARDVINYNMKVWEDNGSSGNPPYTEEQLKYTGAGADWLKLTTRDGQTQSHQVSISGGSDRMTMFISANYTDDEGILLNTDYNRFSGRMNLDYKLNSAARFGASMFLVKNKKTYQNMGTNAANNNIMYRIFMLSPLVYPDGMNVFGERERKPAIFDEINDLDQKQTGNNVYATLYSEVDILKSLTARVQYTYSHDQSKQQQYYPQSTNVGLAEGGIAFISNEQYDKGQLDALLTWHQKFADMHDIKLLGGFNHTKLVSEANEMQATGFSTDQFGYNNIGLAQNIGWIGSGKAENTKQSFFSRLEYVLNDKYIFNASFRADGASHFGAGNKWGYFPSGSFAWQLGDEPFMNFIKPTFYDLKLRASYGITGNDGIRYYQSLFQFSVRDVYLGGDVLVKGMFPSNPENANLKWESTTQLDLGIDFSLLNKRIEVNFDYYRKKTKDLLNPIAVSSSTGGLTTMMGNNGEIENKGFELFVKSNNLKSKDWSWSTSLNLSRNKNKVLKLNKGEARFESLRPHGNYEFQEYVMLKEGFPLSSLYGYVFDGIIQTGETYSAQPTSVPGDVKFKDLDGDGIITNNDRKVIGDGNPDVIIGLGNNFTYKDFDFSFFIESSIGNELLNLTRILLEDQNRLQESADRWTQRNPSTTVPRNGYNKFAGMKYGSYINSRFVEDASYVRLQNIEMGYSLPLRKWGNMSKYIKNMRVFVGAQNLITITGYKGFDPDVSTNGGSAVSQGLDFSSYPAYRMFNFGAKITF